MCRGFDPHPTHTSSRFALAWAKVEGSLSVNWEEEETRTTMSDEWSEESKSSHEDSSTTHFSAGSKQTPYLREIAEKPVTNSLN